VTVGARLRFETSDSAYEALTGTDVDAGLVSFQKVNALSGPVYVEGARPGSAIGFRIEEIETGSRVYAVYVQRWRSEMFGLAESAVVQANLNSNAVQLTGGGMIQCQPMIGCIGVAPFSGSVSSLGPSVRTGGNLDLVEMRPGTTVWFPVEVEGALLSVGDIHARMGRGEPLGSGLECAGAVTGTVLVASDMKLDGPVLCDSNQVMFVGTSATDWRDAEASAVRAAWNWLTIICGVPKDDAILISAALFDVCAGGPAGNNVVASIQIDALAEAGVRTTVWPIELCA
jgi:acetamidase/formamidase